MRKGGMQSSRTTYLLCKCGKPTSKIIQIEDKEISIHFTRKSTFWHISEKGRVKKTLNQPKEWK